MSRFYGSMQGSRGPATRQGTATSGISAHIRGWNIGARVSVVDQDGNDTVYIYATSGSNGRTPDVLLARITRHPDGQTEIERYGA